MKTKVFFSLGLFGAWLSTTSAPANPLTQLSAGPATISAASGVIVTDSLRTFSDGGSLVVMGIEAAGEGILLTLKSSADTTAVSVRIPAATAGAASVAVGTTVQAVAESTGYALMASGKLIGFIPNEVGKSLIHHSQREK